MMDRRWAWQYDWKLIGDHGDRPTVPGANALDHNRRGEPWIVHLTHDLAPGDERALFAPGSIVALSGGDALVNWILRKPERPEIEVVGLRKVAPEQMTAIAAAPFFAQVKRLVLREGTLDIGKLLASPHLRALEALVVFDAHRDTLRAIAAHAWPALKELRIIGPYPSRPLGPEPNAGFDLFVRVFQALQARLTLLHVDRLPVPLDELAGTPASESLQRLGLDRCRLRGGEVFEAFGELVELTAENSSFDDEAAIGVASCTRLEILELSGSHIGDTGAAAIATGRTALLRILDLRDTDVGDAGAIALARSTTLGNLERVRLPPTLGWPAVVEGRRAHAQPIRDAVRASVPTLEHWLPRSPTPEPGTDDRATALWHRSPADAVQHASERGWWPEPPTGVSRRFIFEAIEHCSCGGSGCEYHVESKILPRHDADVPESRNTVIAIARTAPRFRRAEAIAVQLLTSLGHPVFEIAWHVYHAAWFQHVRVIQPPWVLAHLVDRLDLLAQTPLWPYVALDSARMKGPVSDDDPEALAAAFTDLGYWFLSLEGKTLHLTMHGTLGRGPEQL